MPHAMDHAAPRCGSERNNWINVFRSDLLSAVREKPLVAITTTGPLPRTPGHRTEIGTVSLVGP